MDAFCDDWNDVSLNGDAALPRLGLEKPLHYLRIVYRRQTGAKQTAELHRVFINVSRGK